MCARHKLILQFALSAALALYAMFHPLIGTSIAIPFTANSLDLGYLLYPFVMVVIVAVVNAVNLNDGLDGLASGVTLIVMLFFLMSALSRGIGRWELCLHR
jgi:phospho-N-acetylmuramoyl-pentapeptide-transferase